MKVQKGQLLRPVVDIRAACLMRLRSPLVKEKSVSLRAGEVLIVTFVAPFKSPRLHCRPRRYQALEAEFVHSDTLRDSEYRGYSIGLDISVVDHDCELVEATDDRPS